MGKVALITGITGQDGSYLAEFLIGKGYTVHGIRRRTSTFTTQRIDHLIQDSHLKDTRLFLHYGDLADGGSLRDIVFRTKPDEVYNLGAQSHVRVSFDTPVYTTDIVGTGTLRLLEAVKDYRRETKRDIRFYQASSSEMYGKVVETPQTEKTPFYPRSPYACAKLFGHYITINYRESYDLFACCGILFNHESPRRGETFVTRKITRGATRIKVGLQKKLYLGNLEAKRDWGFAGDYVEMMWQMLQQPTAEDYVIATGETHSVREFCEKAFSAVGLDYKQYVELDPMYYRPTEVDLLLGNPAKAIKNLGWKPKVSFDQMIKMMVDEDLKLAERDKALKSAGL